MHTDQPSDLFGETIIVKVGTGETQKSFTLHKGILCHYSGYFKAALNRKFAEATAGVVELPEDEVKVFEAFVIWLYTKTFNDNGEAGNLSICKLWVFADRRQIPKLVNDMIEDSRKKSLRVWISPNNELRYLYENTTNGAELRRFVVYFITRYGNPSMLAHESSKNWPRDAFRDLLAHVWQVGTGKKDEMAVEPLCGFHRHEDGITCAGGVSS